MLKPAEIERALRGVDDQSSFLAFLADTLGWPIDPAVREVGEITYRWSAADLRSANLDETLKARQIASLDPKQPWGIFLLEFKKPDAFLNDRGITGTLRKVLRGLVESRAKDASTPSWKREHLLFVCTHDYKHFRFAYFKKPPGDLEPGASKTPPLAAFGWVQGKPSQTAFRYNLPHLEWPEDPSDTIGWVEAWTKAFDVERVTDDFFKQYTAIHKTFVETVRNVDGEDRRKWIASICLNRLMFVYFLQRRGFLDKADPEYLEHHFAANSKKHAGQFYRRFLTTLFFEGFATQERSDPVKALIGDIKYLNGGLFVRNPVELAADAAKKPIDWPDESFDAALKLFAKYSWNLDDAASGDDNEINPDVLGYIFERYINDRADMGAYYTKEDITDYIGKNTILPFLLDKVAAACPDAFKPDGPAWRKLSASPSTYIYPSVRRGVLDAADKPIPLPDDIAAGMDDVAKRSGWNRPAPAPFGLPTETWREHVARRQRCLSLHAKLAAGEVSSVNDLITLNLDVTRFTLDLIADGDAADAPVVDAFAGAIEKLSVLDPTCGSGAFLFAALNLLTDVYDACLTRMDAFVRGFASTPETKLPRGLVDPLKRFCATIARVNDHASRGYFVAKQIIVNNLYGVDLMPEAVEICKLRLFLRLVGKVDRVDQVEPLPDIDFNVQPGNTLVGFASEAEADKAMDFGTMDFGARKLIKVRMAAVDVLMRKFRDGQLAGGGKVASDAHKLKADLVASLDSLRDELDKYLATATGHLGKDKLAAFRDSHRPFHWHVEFYAIMQAGGFDIVLGNPPYVEYKDVRSKYRVTGFETIACDDLYAFTMERSVRISKSGSYLGMIVPISLPSVDGFSSLRSVLSKSGDASWLSTFAERPAKLFEGVEKRLCIWIQRRNDSVSFPSATRYHRWNAEERPHVFETIAYGSPLAQPPLVGTSWPKIDSATGFRILNKLAGFPQLRAQFGPDRGPVVYYTRKLRYHIQFLDFVPKLIENGTRIQPSELKELHFKNARDRAAALLSLNSNLFFWFFCAHSDIRNVNRREVDLFRIPLNLIEESVGTELIPLANELMQSFKDNSLTIENYYKKEGRTLKIQTFQPRASMPLVERCDQLIGAAIGLSEAEVDYVCMDAIKYRMGAED